MLYIVMINQISTGISNYCTNFKTFIIMSDFYLDMFLVQLLMP